jgi:CBS domain-containing protein
LNIQDIMTRAAKCCSAEDSLDAAARLMWENDCGAAPVMDDDGHVVAMLTDRDICMAAYTQGRPLADIRVKSAMSCSLHSIGPDDPIARAERIMQEQQVRRLPVIDAQGHLVGIVSLNDIAREAARERTHKQRPVDFDNVALTLAAVCRPRICAVEPSALQRVPAEPLARRMASVI